MLESPSPFVAGAHAKEHLRRKWIEKYDNRVPIFKLRAIRNIGQPITVLAAMRQVFAFPLVRLVIIAAGCAAILTIALAAEGGRHSIWISIVVTSIVVTLLVGLIALVERITTGRSLASIGFDPRNAGRDIMLGLGLGTLMFSVVILVLAWAGTITCQRCT